MVKGENAKSNGKIPIAVIKPYFEGNGEYPRDKNRVFAKALGNARPWDNCDLQISNQFY